MPPFKRIDSIFAPFVPASLLATLAFLVDFETPSNDFFLVDVAASFVCKSSV